MHARLSGLALQRIKIQNFAIRVNWGNSILVRFHLQIRKRIETLLHADQRIAQRRTPARPIARQRVQHAPVVVHIFVARFAIHIARKRDLRSIWKQFQQLVAQRLVIQRKKRPRPQPGPLERNQIDVDVAAFRQRPALRLSQPCQAFIFLPARSHRRADFFRRVRIRRAQTRLMHFHVPLQVRILMHLVGPRRRLQFEPAHHGHHFLPIRHPHPRLRRRHRHRLRCHKILFRQECPAQITIHSCGILNARPVSRSAGLAVLCFVAHAGLAFIQRSGATKDLSSIAALTQPIAVKTALLFRPTIRTNVHILPNPHFPRPNLRLRMKAKPLPIHHKSHVRPDLPVRPQTERFLHDQIPHAIISFDQLRHFRRRLRRRHILLGLRRRREKPYSRHVLRQHRHQR